jgi:uncharacterized protein YktA (UPF0223 family)
MAAAGQRSCKIRSMLCFPVKSLQNKLHQLLERQIENIRLVHKRERWRTKCPAAVCEKNFGNNFRRKAEATKRPKAIQESKNTEKFFFIQRKITTEIKLLAAKLKCFHSRIVHKRFVLSLFGPRNSVPFGYTSSLIYLANDIFQCD